MLSEQFHNGVFYIMISVVLGDEMLIRRERLSLTLKDNTFLHCFTLFICGGPCHLIFLWEKAYFIHVWKHGCFLSLYYSLINIGNITFLSLNFLSKTTEFLFDTESSIYSLIHGDKTTCGTSGAVCQVRVRAFYCLILCYLTVLCSSKLFPEAADGRFLETG